MCQRPRNEALKTEASSDRHLVVVPVPEEVDGPVSPGLNDGPAPIVDFLFTPHLQLPFHLVRFDEKHAASGVASVVCLVTVPEETWKERPRSSSDITRPHFAFRNCRVNEVHQTQCLRM